MNGKWITCDREVETPMFRRTFTAHAPKSAKIEVTGLGYFRLFVNGKAVTSDRFTPAQTDYKPRNTAGFSQPIFDTLSHKVFFLEYDITSFLSSGENTVDILVGNGWFRQKERYPLTHGCRYSEELVAAYEITLRDGEGTRTLLSDGSETTFVSPILFSNIFVGETVDMRLYDSPFPVVPTLLSDFVPERLLRQTCLPDRVVRTVTPELLFVKDGRRIYDAGENITGYATAKLRGKSGENAVFTYAEELDAEGNLDHFTAGGTQKTISGNFQIQHDTFILSGKEQTPEPTFTWHGFRYFEIASECEPTEVTVHVLHTAVAVTSSFTCDNEILNFLYDSYIRTQLDNIHGCVPSDCPTRERIGYTGDGQICAPTAMMLLDTREVYRKWIDDILDCQGKENGHIQHTAPLEGGGGGPGGWGCAIFRVPYCFYRAFGEKEMLAHTYGAMTAYLDYLRAHSENHLVVREEKDGWCLGDWASAGKMAIPEPFVNTCYLITSLEILAEVTELLGKPGADGYLAEADLCRAALAEKYYANGRYLDGIQGTDAYAVWAKLPHAEESAKALIALCEEHSLREIDPGFLGLDILCEVLVSLGRADLTVSLLSDASPDSFFGMMKNHGATTIWEYSRLVGHGTHNHPMFGAATRQLFAGLLGIRALEAGYREVKIEPCFTSPVSRASGSIRTPTGDIAVSFVRAGGKVSLSVTVPHGINARLSASGKEIPLPAGESKYSFSLDSVNV